MHSLLLPITQANRVLIHYCDGGSFSGDRTEPLTDASTGNQIFVRGKRILEAVFEDLLVSQGMDAATDVLLTGTSAGGLATFLHADHVQELLPSSVKRYGTMPISGFFLDHVDINGSSTYGDELRYVFDCE